MEIITYTCTINTPVGVATVSAEEDALTGLWLIGQKYYGSDLAAYHSSSWTERVDYPVFEALRFWISKYFSKENPTIDFKLNPQGTPFQKKIWELLLEIPYGQTTTYGALAKELVKREGLAPMSAQAVGGAVGRNPISVLIPCHRVVGAKGSLTGYAGGIDKKIQLLQLEGVDMTTLYTPTKGTAL